MNDHDKPKTLRVQNISGSIQHVTPGRLIPPDGVAELNEAEQVVFQKGLDGNPTRQRQFKATWAIVAAPEDDATVAKRVVRRTEPVPVEPVVPAQPAAPGFGTTNVETPKRGR